MFPNTLFCSLFLASPLDTKCTLRSAKWLFLTLGPKARDITEMGIQSLYTLYLLSLLFLHSTSFFSRGGVGSFVFGRLTNKLGPSLLCFQWCRVLDGFGRDGAWGAPPHLTLPSGRFQGFPETCAHLRANFGEAWWSLANPQCHIHQNLPDIHQSSRVPAKVPYIHQSSGEGALCVRVAFRMCPIPYVHFLFFLLLLFFVEGLGLTSLDPSPCVGLFGFNLGGVVGKGVMA